MNISEMREESLRIANQARALLDTITSENRSEKEAEFDKMMVDSDALATRAEKAEKAEARNREFSQIVTPIADKNDETRANDNMDEKRGKAFDRYLRGEINGGELRAMGISDNNKGGFTVPKTFSDRVISSLQTRGPMLNPAVVNYVVTDGGNPIAFPVFNDAAKAVIVAENTSLGYDDLSFEQKSIGAYKYTSKIFLVSRELLEDSSIDVDVLP